MRRLGGLLVALVLAPAAHAAPEGPPLAVTATELSAAMECSGDLSQARRDPVLLTPAFSTADESYGWNYRRRMPEIGYPTCTLTMPDHGFGDLQRTAEYVVGAVRRMRAASNRQVVLLGHQHGALDEMWAMRFWPDVARGVSDFVSLATPYNGTTSSAGLCRGGGGCAPSLWQITKGSRFLDALSRAPLPRGPGYTSIATAQDVLITPQPEASRLAGARNVLVQDVCPGRTVDHFGILADAVGYRLVLDALGHPGPADPARVARSACGEQFMPSTDASVLTSSGGFLTGFLARNVSDAVPAEPATRGYAARIGPVLAAGPARVRRSRRGTVPVRVRCRSVANTNCRVAVTLTGAKGRRAGRRAATGVRPGRTTVVRVRLNRHGRGRLRLTVHARDALENAASLRRTVAVRR